MSVEDYSNSYEGKKLSFVGRVARFFELSVNSVINSAGIGAIPGVLIAAAGAPVAGLVAGAIGVGVMAYGGYDYQRHTKEGLPA